MKNTVTLVGFVGNTPEVRTTQSGTAITTVSLATTRGFKDGEGNRQSETEWHQITCFNGIGKSVAEHVTKGAMVMVTGRVHCTHWTDSEGQTRYGCEIVAEQVDFLAKAKEASTEEPKKRRLNSASGVGHTTSKARIGTCRSGLFACRTPLSKPSRRRENERPPHGGDRAPKMAICFRKVEHRSLLSTFGGFSQAPDRLGILRD